MKVKFDRITLLIILIYTLILIGTGLVIYLIFPKKVPYTERQFTSPHGTVTYKERGGVGPQTSRDILLDKSLTEANLTTDTKAQKFLLDQARETGAIFIEKDCKLSPVVAKLPNDQPIKFINEDSSSHTVIIDTHSYTIKAQQTLITPDRIKSVHILKVGCDSGQKIQGYIVFQS